MKTKLPLLLCALFIATTVNAQTTSDMEQWQRYTVAGEEFSVKLPVRPVLTALEVFNPQSQEKLTERTLMATAAGVHYWVYSYENTKPRQSLDDFVKEQTQGGQKQKLVDKQKLEIDGVKRYEYRWVSQNRPRTEQYIATEKRLYRFLVDGASADDAVAKAFFSSILLGKKPEGLAIDPSPGDEKVYDGKEVDKKARMTKFFPPIYTDEARKNKVTGVVILKVVFSSTGQVTNVSVVSGLPFGLTGSAIAAARKLQFVPAVKDGKNVAMWMQLEYNFDLY